MIAPDPDTVSYLRVFVSCVALIVLLAAFAWGLRVFVSRGWIRVGNDPSKRLRVKETLILDARRRLMIVSCDDKEHLILLGAQQDVVVSSFPPPLEPQSNKP